MPARTGAWRDRTVRLRSNRPMDDFHGRTVLVTGGDGGVGTAVAAQFAARGATVILAGIRPARRA